MKIKKYITIAAVTLLLFTGCNSDWLQLSNPNQQTTDTFWKTKDDAVKGINAIYQSLYYDGSYLRFCQLALDLRADDIVGDSPWDVMHNTGAFSLPNNAIMQEWLWVVFYGGVYRANQAIANIDKIDMDQTLKNRLKGEALFLRGLYYFHLINFFNNIPLITTPFEKAADYYTPQSSPEAVWKQIISDFDEASKLLPVSYTGNDLGRATKGAALGYLGKSYLFNKRYTEAAAAFKSVMDLNVYGLMDNYRDNFTEKYENNKESLFEVQFSRDAGGTVLGWVDAPGPDWSKTTARAITYGPENFGFSDVIPSRWIFNEFQVEKTVDGNADPRLQASMFYNYPGCTLYGKSFQDVYANDLTKIFPRKYENDDSGRPDEFDWRSGINERLMRYSDILLMYAECLNELGRTSEAYDYVQQVRDRAKLPDLKTTKPGMSKEQMRDQLAHERALEFCFEGHRFDDIRRWGWLQDPQKLSE
ncbi:MAG: RagB/SusD family nutrient uptake outer membrane protein, partial [Bacteroidota bacterium]|nr:RagB/SusD family nutrient uptake outer membrane protein [Bacteroidota bacterium]